MTKNLHVVKDDVLEKWLKPMCPRLMGRRCTTLYCLKRGGYTGEPADASIATCEPYEAYNALSSHNDAATRMREACVEKMREVLRPYELEFRRKTNSATNIVDYVAMALESLTLDGEK